ncbi:NAD(P)-binding protein [Xylariaceae sp. FL1651]|nr:NAD(P)-binding protein [Xylariaceae sp. FL1651]
MGRCPLILGWPPPKWCFPNQKLDTRTASKMATTGMRPRGTILITGLNGYLAGRTAEIFLRHGYRVRGTVRNKPTGERVKEALCTVGYCADDIEVIHIPDICELGPLEVAATGCCAILHLASPIRDIWRLPPSEVVQTAVESVKSVLNAAARAGDAIKSVVLVSSAAALFDTPLEARLYNEKDWNTASEGIVKREGKDAGGFHAYLASKTAAEKLFWKYRETHRPPFAMTALQPTYIIGVPLIAWETPTAIPYSIINIWKVVADEEVPGPTIVYEDTIDVEDVARMMVWSVSNPAKADGERFVCSSAVGGGQAIADIIARCMPLLKIQRGSPKQGYSPDYKPRAGVGGFDSSKAVAVTGQDWIPYEESVVNLAKFLTQYLA